MTRDEYVAAVAQAQLNHDAIVGAELENSETLESEEQAKTFIASIKRSNVEKQGAYNLSHVDKWVAANGTGDLLALMKLYVRVATERADLDLLVEKERLHAEFAGS